MLLGTWMSLSTFPSVWISIFILQDPSQVLPPPRSLSDADNYVISKIVDTRYYIGHKSMVRFFFQNMPWKNGIISYSDFLYNRTSFHLPSYSIQLLLWEKNIFLREKTCIWPTLIISDCGCFCRSPTRTYFFKSCFMMD